jgi:hypothetical protein
MKWTPLHISIMLHYFTTPTLIEHASSISTVEFTLELIREGLLASTNTVTTIHTINNKYRVTDKGKAFINKILSTPIPVKVTTWE